MAHAGVTVRRDGRDAEVPLKKKETVIGRTEGNDIVIPERKVSRNHAKILRTDEGFVLLDLQSANGTFVNGNKVHRKLLAGGDRILIGPCELTFWLERTAREKKAAPAPSEKATAFKARLHSLLLDRMDLKRADFDGQKPEEIRLKIRPVVESILTDLEPSIPASLRDRERLVKEILDEALGLGPLEDLLEDSEITEIMVNRADQIYVERKGKIECTGKRFLSEAQVRAVIERIVAPLGRRIDESSPLVDARLKDGSRVNAIIPPLAIKGPCITIRKFSETPFTVEDLIRFKTLDRRMADFLRICILSRQNIVISGGTGSGKTTLLNVLSSFIPEEDRIITIEDSAELQLPQEHVVSLETRPPNIEGKGAVTIRDLVKNALRMRPDRIVVGECRGGEALDMLQAMNTGHDGSLTTGHANSPRDILSRMETMVLMAGMDLPSRAIREQIAAAVNLIVHEARMSDGTRKVTHISEVTGSEGDKILLQDIFLFRQEGIGEKGVVLGGFAATGLVPRFVQGLRERGISVPMELFEVTEG